VQLSSDGVPFIFHDDVFDRLTVAKGRSGARAIAEVQTLTLIGSSTNEVPQAIHRISRPGRWPDTDADRTQEAIERRRNTKLAGTVATALRNYNGPYTIESSIPTSRRRP